MVFHYFGKDVSSWAFGNSKFSMASNLPPALQEVWNRIGEPFQDKSMSGTRILWMSTSTVGHYCIALTDGTVYSNHDDLFAAIRNYKSYRSWVTIVHASFSASGAWFVKWSDGNAQVGSTAQTRFPDSFTALAAPYLQLSGPASQAPQPTVIDNVFFGANDAVIIKINNYQLLWDRLAPGVESGLQAVLGSQDITIGSATTLCPYNPELYLMELVSRWSFNTNKVWAWVFEQPFSDLLFNEITAGNRPAAHLLPKPGTTQPVPPQMQTQTQTQPQSRPHPTPAPKPAAIDENAMAAKLEAQIDQFFRQHNGSKGYLNTAEATAAFQELAVAFGLARSELGRIWNQTDADQNGQFDKDEFTHAVLQMALSAGVVNPTLTSSSASGAERLEPRWCIDSIYCDKCRKRMVAGDQCFHCDVCVGGDFDLCVACHDGGQTCPHAMDRRIVTHTTRLSPRWTTSLIVCSACRTSVHVGMAIYYCSVCDNGDYDLCMLCYKNPFKSCTHTMELRRVTRGAPGPQQPTTGLYPSTSTGANQNNSSGPPPSQQSDSSNSGTGSGSTDEIDKLSRKFQDTQLRESLMSAIVSEKPDVKWDDVAGLEQAKDELQEAIVFPQRFPQMYQGKRKARRAILLYGPPGTGKSYLAKAVANEVDHTLFSISSGDVMSKWYGESESLVRQLFKLAREKKPAIIFIDEIDALCSNREGGGGRSNEDTARMKTEFLVQMDGVGNDNTGVLLLAATNLPWALDPAVRRRFQKRIHIPLPDAAARKQLFKVHIGDLAKALSERDFDELARRTEGLSGSDIANAVQDALMVPIKTVYAAKYFRKVYVDRSEWYTPCGAQDQGAVSMTWKQVPAKQLKEPALAVGDFFKVLEGVKPTVGADDIRKCHEWTAQFGLEGA